MGNLIAEEIPQSSFLNDKPLTPAEVCEKINESRCGLILSGEEGACFASSEYLLCGIPVVSTHSKGGRSVWYNEYNSIVCEDNEDSVAAAVQEFIKNPRDPEIIRNGHLSLSRHYRVKFITVLSKLFYNHGIYDIDASQYFHDNFIHKLRRSYRPNLEEIFG